MLKWIFVIQVLVMVRLLAASDGLVARVVILANSRQPESIALAQFYAEKRGIPRVNIIALPLPEAESVSWREFIDQVYRPLQKQLIFRGWIDASASNLGDRLGRDRYTVASHHISYLVTCRGVPLRVNEDSSLLDEGTGRRVGRDMYRDAGSVDAELSLLAQSGYEITGSIPNPFFGQVEVTSLDAGKVIKVSRLDGPTFEQARQLVTSALEAERTGLLGRAYFDLQGPHPDGDQWLEACQRILDGAGFEAEFERTTNTFGLSARFDAPVFYFGWYANDINGPFTLDGFRFPPGAVAVHIHNFSAQTLRSETQGWCGPFVARGVTATVGNVFEPYLPLSHRPDLLLQALSQGKNFGDAVYFALPALSWQSVAIGDPLYRPFKVSLEQQEQRMGTLPPALAPYVLTRRANILLSQGKTEEGWTVIRGGLRDNPSLILGLSCARMAVALKLYPVAVDALNLIVNTEMYHAENWAMLHEVAGLLSACGAQPAALTVYAKLVKLKAPSLDAQKALLTEAKAVAGAAGDQALGLEFARLLSELSPSAVAK